MAAEGMSRRAPGCVGLAADGSAVVCLLQLHMLGAMNEAVPAGLGGLLCETFKGCLVREGGRGRLVKCCMSYVRVAQPA